MGNGFKVGQQAYICGPVTSELSMSNRIRLSKFRFSLLYRLVCVCTLSVAK